MATFYLLPPRECVDHAVAEFCRQMLPGVEIPAGLAERFLEALTDERADRYVVHREDLPGLGGLADDLTGAFGAEPGDEVVEVGFAAGSVPGRVRRWAILGGVSEPAAGR